MKVIQMIVVVMMCCIVTFADGGRSDIATIPATKDSMPLLPVPNDYKNYFILQSFEKLTNVIIGDFGGSEKIICLIVDRDSDNTVDEVIEYYPESGTFSYPPKPTTKLFSEYPRIKRDIIEGKVFKDSAKANNTEYTHEMASLPVLLLRIKEGRHVSKRGPNGVYVKNTDPDLRNTIMSDYYCAREQGRYFLQFRTLYYKSGSSKIVPPIQHSVYCRDSSDPIVKEYVEMLFIRAREKRIN